MRHGEPMYTFGGAADSLSLEYGQAMRDSRESSLKNIFWNPDSTRNVTWVYLIGGQLRVFTFMGHMALGLNNPSTMILYKPPNLDVMLQLAALSSSYARLAGATQWNAFSNNRLVPAECQRWYRDVVRQQRGDAAVAVTTDTYLRRFSKPIEASLQIAALGQPSAGTGELLAVIAVRTQALMAEPVPGDSNAVVFRVRLQLAAIDSLTGEAVRADTVRTIRATRQSMQRRAPGSRSLRRCGSGLA